QFGDAHQILAFGRARERSYSCPFSLPHLRSLAMARLARLVIPGMSHHVTQRGVRRLDVFRDDADRLLYLKLFAQSAYAYQLTVRAYTLMSNHVHFVVTPGRPDSIHRVFHWCHGTYVEYFNEKYSLAGHLWEQRP